ncbi:MAG: acetylglutamate kinase [Winogradskyella sp.]|uniref:acetylglutamate kinase n=1 Tax=Winogradskyella sp. TaxID=1883156 RepID=UPI001838E11D|nr:acetylglutamate kinase [Winogradskyella sp.]MBT8245715.1 acetylglutamate kinase [Winogradskyella sp.]NNK22375.1 acetylglutamate kinase [Winogradskyella sp.]
METLKVIKIGGNIIDDSQALTSFLTQFAQLEGQKLLVHGGGKLATQLANQMNVPVNINNGRRITDAETLDIITMVYAGKINKNIVAQLQANSCNAIGFSGADGNTIVSKKRPIKHLDYGFVGDVKQVSTNTLKILLDNDITPIFCAITHDNKGQLLNTNADTIASELAIGFAKDFKVELYYCFEKKGVLKDVSDDNSVIKNINTQTYKTLITEGIITEGMLPKLNNCFHAINKKVNKICVGKSELLFSTNATYTTIKK